MYRRPWLELPRDDKDEPLKSSMASAWKMRVRG